MDEFQSGPRHLPDREQCLRVVQTQTLASLIIRPRALGKRLVVGPATFLKLLLKDAPLAVRKVDPVFEALTHILSVPRLRLKRKSVHMSAVGLKPLTRVTPLYPRAKAPGLYGLFP